MTRPNNNKYLLEVNLKIGFLGQNPILNTNF